MRRRTFGLWGAMWLCSFAFGSQLVQAIPPKHSLLSKKKPGKAKLRETPKPVLQKTTPSKKNLPQESDAPLTASNPPCEQDPTALFLWHYTTHEKYCFQPSERLSPEQQTALNHLFRCHHTHQEHEMDVGVIQLLAKIVHTIHPSDSPTRVTIIAGYRAPEQAKAMGNGASAHAQGKALDFFIEDMEAAHLFDKIRSQFHGVRLIYYPNHSPSFVHIAFTSDRKDSFQIDDSFPGQPSVYRNAPPIELTESTPPHPHSPSE